MSKRDVRDLYQADSARGGGEDRIGPDVYNKKPNELADYERLLRELERRPIGEIKDRGGESG
jgi:hypothetical protein